jgi:hypothetical protein
MQKNRLAASAVCFGAFMGAALLLMPTPAAAQDSVIILFDGAEEGIGDGTTDFSYAGSSWSGGFVASQGDPSLYASGAFSYHVDDGTATVTFDQPADFVTFFYVYGGGFPQGTATAYAADDTPLGSADSKAATSFGDAGNFVTLDPEMGIARLEITGGVIDNFEFQEQVSLPTTQTAGAFVLALLFTCFGLYAVRAGAYRSKHAASLGDPS